MYPFVRPWPVCLLAATLALSPAFTEVALPPIDDAAPSRSVSWADYDGDGRVDLFVATWGPDRTLHHEAGDAFSNATTGPLSESGSTHGGVWGDVDGDGDLDLYVFKNGLPNRLVRNDGPLGWTDVTHGTLGDTGNSHCAVFADYDADGDLDLFLSSYGSTSRLWRNEAGVFVEVTPAVVASGDKGAQASWVDADADGDLDLYQVVDGGPNHLFVQGPVGVFTESTPAPLNDGAKGFAGIWGDVDNDGDFDLYLTILDGPNRLLRNDGGLQFVDATSGVLADANRGYAAAWADHDLDGDLDLYLANRFAPNRLFENDGAGGFADVTPASMADPGSGWGVAWADYDLDGDLDLYLANHDTNNRLYRNDQSAGNHWLHLDLQGVLSNRHGVGARVEVTAGGLTQVREFRCGSGNGSQDSLTEEFGLGTATVVDTLRVIWPGGFEQVLHSLPVDRRLTVVEGQASARTDGGFLEVECWPNPARRATNFHFALSSRRPTRLDIFDLRGRRVRSLASPLLEAGEHDLLWNGRDESGAEAAAGTYLYRVRVGSQVATGRFVLLR